MFWWNFFVYVYICQHFDKHRIEKQRNSLLLIFVLNVWCTKSFFLPVHIKDNFFISNCHVKLLLTMKLTLELFFTTFVTIYLVEISEGCLWSYGNHKELRRTKTGVHHFHISVLQSTEYLGIIFRTRNYPLGKFFLDR